MTDPYGTHLRRVIDSMRDLPASEHRSETLCVCGFAAREHVMRNNHCPIRLGQFRAAIRQNEET